MPQRFHESDIPLPFKLSTLKAVFARQVLGDIAGHQIAQAVGKQINIVGRATTM
jgi:hypothetical protein